MAATKSSAKASPAKQPVLATGGGKAKPATAKALKKEPVSKAAPKKPASGATPKAAAELAARPAAKPATKPARAKAPPDVPPEQRRHYVEMAAYYIAERRGFVPGDPLTDWVLAEAEIDRLLAEGLLGK